jgi:hypothetical protein
MQKEATRDEPREQAPKATTAAFDYGRTLITTSHGRRSWKDSPTAKTIAATISLLLISGLIVMFAAIV